MVKRHLRKGFKVFKCKCKEFKVTPLPCQASFWPWAKDVRRTEVRTVLTESMMIKFFLRFAEVEMHVLVITLLRRFRISYHHSPVAIATSFVNKPDRPLKLRFFPRYQGGSYEAAITPEVCGRGRIP